MNAAEFEKWLKRAKPGARTTYHYGFLIRDRGDPPTTPASRAIDGSAKAAMAASGAGLVVLVQRRQGYMQYDYMAVRSRRPLAAADLIG